jgi:hypothetical protein
LTPQLTSSVRTILRMYWLSSTTRMHNDWMTASISFFESLGGMFVRRPNAPITGERHQITPPLPLHQVKADNFIHQCGEG